MPSNRSNGPNGIRRQAEEMMAAEAARKAPVEQVGLSSEAP